MLRIATLISLLFITTLGLAETPSSLYQIDVIVFTHQASSSESLDLSLTPLLVPNARRAITLKPDTTNTMAPYRLLPATTSRLRNEYWALNQEPQYDVLFHYTWIQPQNNQRPVVLPKINRDGWQVEGTLRVRKSNYYLLDTELLFSTLSSNQPSFLFSQKKRLKDNEIYYLDHPQAGMLIKIHELS